MLWSTKRVRLLQAVAASTLAAPLTLAPAAAADSQVTLRPAAGPPGTLAVLTGRGFPAGRRLDVRAGGAPLARARADSRGGFSSSVTVPGGQRPAWRLRSGSGRRRVTSVFAASHGADVAEVASSTGRRLRWGPLVAGHGDSVRLVGFGFRPGERVRVSLFGRLAGLRASARGRIRLELVASRNAGRRRGAVRAGGVSLPLSVAVVERDAGVPGADAPASPAPAAPAPPALGPGNLGASGDPLIVAAGDIACDETTSHPGPASCRHRDTANLLLDPAIDTVLALGDLQYEHGSLGQFTGSYSLSWGEPHLKSITRPVVGNHEYMTTGAAGYFDYFNGVGGAAGPAGARGQGWYSFDLGAWHLVALNSNCGSAGGCGPGSPQETWLRADLAAHPRACTLAYMHHPRFSSGAHGSFTNVQPLWQALYDAGAEVVLSGHDHDYERYLPQDAAGTADAARGIRELVVGTGGRNLRGFPAAQPPNSEVRDAKAFGILKMALRPAGYEWEFVPAAGFESFSDHGVGACH
jgi:hypothetical protein